MSISVCHDCEVVVEGSEKIVMRFPYDDDPDILCPYCDEPVIQVSEGRDD